MKKIITSIAAAAVLSTSAFAGQLLLSTDGTNTPASIQSPLSIDMALAKNAPYDVVQSDASAPAKYITYIPGVALGENYTIKMTASGGGFQATNNWVIRVATKTAAEDAAVGSVAGTVTDFTVDSAGNYSDITFVLSDTVNSNGFEYDTTFTINNTATGLLTDGYTLKIAKGNTGDMKIAMIEAKTASAVDLTAPNAALKSVVTAGKTIGATYTDSSNVIDVNSDRVKLLLNATTPAGVIATGTIAVTNTDTTSGNDIDYNLASASVTPLVTAAANAAATLYTLVISGDMTGILSMTLGGGTTSTIDAAAGTATFTQFSEFTEDLTGAGSLLTATVSGTDVLDTRTFKMDLKLDENTKTINNTNLLSNADEHQLINADSMVFGINGYQAYSPYIISNSDTFTYVKIVNGASISSDVSFDTVDEDGNTATGLIVPTVYQGNTYAPLAANSTGTYNAAKILELAQDQNPLVAAAAGKEGKFAIKMTVNGSQSKIYSTVVQTIGGARERVFQVYHDASVDYDLVTGKGKASYLAQ